MSIVGNWKVKKIMHFEGDEPKLITIDEFNAIPEEQRDEEQAQMASLVLDITEDGKLTMMIPIPTEAIEEARAEGAEVTDDGYVIADRFEWLKRDDKYFCHNESMGTDPMPLKIHEDGGLEFMGGLLIFEKI